MNEDGKPEARLRANLSKLLTAKGSTNPCAKTQARA